MKNTRQCPKCESRDLMEVNGKKGQNQSTVNAIALSAFSAAIITRYVCTNCGYSEEWIIDNDLDKVRKKYNSYSS